MAHTYKDSFFNYIDVSSSRSARNFLQEVKLPFPISSILDVGCGRGAWLAEWSNNGVKIFGVDGAYVDLKNLLIPKEKFAHQDISKPFFVGQNYDIVQCLEVAEHLPEAYATVLIQNLVTHGKIILFSAAVPGQGGEHHVNEQPLSYWVERFERNDFLCFDYIRPQILDKTQIEPWYRYNSLLFVHRDIASELNHDVLKTQADANYDFNKIVSKGWLLRNALLKQMPTSLINLIAKFKHYLVVAIKR